MNLQITSSAAPLIQVIVNPPPPIFQLTIQRSGFFSFKACLGVINLQAYIQPIFFFLYMFGDRIGQTEETILHRLERPGFNHYLTKGSDLALLCDLRAITLRRCRSFCDRSVQLHTWHFAQQKKCCFPLMYKSDEHCFVTNLNFCVPIFIIVMQKQCCYECVKCMQVFSPCICLAF